MAIAYIVLLSMAALGVGLGLRLTSLRSELTPPRGLARLLQLAISLTALLAMALLVVPWLNGLSNATCDDETLRAGKCVAGLREEALFGSAVFVCLLGVGFAYVLRRGVLDTPLLHRDESESESTEATPRKQTGPGSERHMHGKAGEERPDQPELASHPVAAEFETHPHSVPETPDNPPAPPEPCSSAPTEAEPSKAEPDEPSEQPREPSGVMPWRRLEGPVFQAFVDDRVVSVEEAIRTAAQRLRSERVAVVFSRGASKDANEALLELAEYLGAYRYVLEGTAAASEGVPSADKPDPHEADQIAGSDARHAGELALDLAGSLIETVMLLDTRVTFPEFVLGKLTEQQSVCIAHAHDAVSGACQVLLPGTNPGEREGELTAAEGESNERRPRAWLVREILAALRAADASTSETAASTMTPDESSTPEQP